MEADLKEKNMQPIQTDEEISMLRSEIEMLMSERRSLLRIAGAAAAFVANLDSKALPANTYEAAELLGESLNALPEDSLSDALEVIKAHVDPGEAGAAKKAGNPPPPAAPGR